MVLSNEGFAASFESVSCILLTPVGSPEAYIGRFYAGTRPGNAQRRTCSASGQRRAIGWPSRAGRMRTSRAPSTSPSAWATPAPSTRCRATSLPTSLYLDIAGMPAAGYTALSRVATSDCYLLGGHVTREHFVPAM